MGAPRSGCRCLRRLRHSCFSVGPFPFRSGRRVGSLLRGRDLPPFWCLPDQSLPVCVLARFPTFAPDDARPRDRGRHRGGSSAPAGRVDWLIAPAEARGNRRVLRVRRLGRKGEAERQIGAALTGLFADVLRLKDEDRRRLVICGIGAGFAAVFGTPMSGALFGIEVLYLGRIEYAVLFPASLPASWGISPVASRDRTGPTGARRSGAVRARPPALPFGALFGLVALLLIESIRGLERLFRRFEAHPYAVAAVGGMLIALFWPSR